MVVVRSSDDNDHNKQKRPGRGRALKQRSDKDCGWRLDVTQGSVCIRVGAVDERGRTSRAWKQQKAWSGLAAGPSSNREAALDARAIASSREEGFRPPHWPLQSTRFVSRSRSGQNRRGPRTGSLRLEWPARPSLERRARAGDRRGWFLSTARLRRTPYAVQRRP